MPDEELDLYPVLIRHRLAVRLDLESERATREDLFMLHHLKDLESVVRLEM